MMTIDMAKAFNRLDHNVLVTILHDIGVPPCALRLVVSYLSNRHMKVHHQGVESQTHDLPGSGPQGAILTGIFYNIYSNWITARCYPGYSPASRFSKNATIVHAYPMAGPHTPT